MKKNYLLSGIAVIGLISVFFSSCSEEIPDTPPYVRGEWFKFDAEDTVITADAHELLLPVYDIMNDGIQATDWTLGYVKVWDHTMPSYRDPELWPSNPNITYEDWLTIDKQDGKLSLKVKPNQTGYERRVKISVVNDVCSGSIIVSQLPAGKEVDNTPFEVQARYKGHLYSTMATLDENDKLVYESQEFADLMDSLAKKEGLDIVVTESGIMNIFDSDDTEAIEALDDMRTQVTPGTPFGIITPTIRSRANDGFEEMTSSSLGFFAVFDNDTFQINTYISRNFMNFDDVFDIVNLKKHNLNDKITSLAVGYNGTNEEVCAVLTVWEDTDFNFEDNDRTKHRVSFIASYSDKRVSWQNLKSLPCINSRNTWNDRISSLSFHFGYYNNYWKDY